MPIDHAFVSAKAAASDATLIDGPKWNADHLGLWTRRLTANAVSAVTSMADVNGTDLTVPIEASKRYAFRFSGTYISNATTTGLRLSINGPASPARLQLWSQVVVVISTLVPTWNAGGLDGTTYDTPAIVSTAGPGAVICPFVLEGLIENGSNAGNLRPRFASEVAVASGITIHRGATFIVWQTDN